MSTKTHVIEVSESTAAALKVRAEARGMTVSDLLAELVADTDAAVYVDLGADSEEIRELERRWNAVLAGQPTVAHDRVARWLDTWGTPTFQSWRER